MDLWELFQQQLQSLPPLPPPEPEPPDEEWREYEERIATEHRINQEARGRVYGAGFWGGWSFSD